MAALAAALTGPPAVLVAEAESATSLGSAECAEIAASAPLDTRKVKARIAAAEAELKGHGRLVIRKSGTEPLIRVMAEGDDLGLVERLVDDICEAVAAA